MEDIKYQKPKRFRYSAMEKKKFLFIAVTLLYPVVHLLIFWFYVNVDSIMLAFKDTRNSNLMNAWPWDFYSFQTVFRDLASGSTQGQSVVRNLWVLLGKSVLIWTNANIICNVISLLTAYILTKHMIGSRFFRTVFYIPGIVGAVVFSTIMMEIYKAGGPVPELFRSLGVKLPLGAQRGGMLASEETAYWTLIIQQFVLGIGGGNMIIAGAYMKIPQEIFESASLDGCGFFRETFRIAVPCIWTTVSTLMVFALCGIFVADLSFYLYSTGGAYGLDNIGYFMYSLQAGIAQNPYNTWIYGYGAALGILITVITIPVVYLGRFLLSKMSDNVEF